jgi:hypothetical protein
MPVNTAFDLQALANSGFFRQRVKNALGKIAGNIIDPNITPAATAASKSYARQVLGNLDLYVTNLVGWLVTRTNVLSTTISASLVKGQVVVDSDVTDAALESQINSDWPLIAGG